MRVDISYWMCDVCRRTDRKTYAGGSPAEFPAGWTALTFHRDPSQSVCNECIPRVTRALNELRRELAQTRRGDKDDLA